MFEKFHKTKFPFLGVKLRGQDRRTELEFYNCIYIIYRLEWPIWFYLCVSNGQRSLGHRHWPLTNVPLYTLHTPHHHKLSGALLRCRGHSHRTLSLLCTASHCTTVHCTLHTALCTLYIAPLHRTTGYSAAQGYITHPVPGIVSQFHCYTAPNHYLVSTICCW